MNRTLRLSVAFLIATAASAQTPADDPLAMGKMWTFEHPPLAYLEREYGFKPDQKWLDTMRLSALRLGERDNPWCSASFVSPKGLIMTNHHCVREQVTQAQAEKDWIHDGFAARSLDDEPKLPGLTVQQLVAQEDITAKVNEGIADGDDSDAISRKRADNQQRLLAAADAAHPGYLHQVVPLHQGAVVQLYRYKVWEDLRLVLAVNLQTAYFGGDPDNFTYPRWCVDFAFLRAYENDAPADTSAHYFRWRQQGAREGELVFVPGNPGSTSRLLTMAQLECQRDVEYPLVLAQLENSMRILRPAAKRDDGLLTTLLEWENSFKAIKGMHDGLQTPALLARKRAQEQQFQAAVHADPRLQAKFGRVWDELGRLAQRRRAAKPKELFYVPSYSAVIDRAVELAKSVDASLSEIERANARQLAVAMQVSPMALTRTLTVDHFERAAKWLAKDDPYLLAVAAGAPGTDPVDWAAAVAALDKSRLADGKFVLGLLAAGADAVQKSDDRGVVIGRTLWPLLRAAEQETKAVESAIAVQGTLLGQALHAVYGDGVSPDATMTLRFSDGRVLGYDYNGTRAPWATSLYGLYARNIEFSGQEPFDLPRPWLDAQAKLDLAHRLDFASTNDIVGGNSGSCVVDRDLQAVGLVFDGNIESLPNDFYYTQERARAVSVHTDAILDALRVVYDLPRVADELLGKALPGERSK